VSDLYLFVAEMTGVGGLETLTIKVVDELIRRNRRVVMFGRQGEISQLLDASVPRIPKFDAGAICREIRSLCGDPPLEITIVSMHPWGLVWASLFNRALTKCGYTVRGFHLVSHSRAFFFDTRVPATRRILRRAFFRSPPASSYFMNVAARDAHQAYWKTDVSDYPVLTLPLASPSAMWTPSATTGLRVVSVGRLVPFKGYNRAAPNIVRNLRDAGIDLSWDIWGDGPDEELIEADIRRTEVGQWLRLRGVLPYEEFDRTVAGYDLFVGMGTALLEAARMGMPAITAVEATTDETYGFLHQTPLDSIGDHVPDVPTRNLQDVIRAFARLSRDEVAAVGKACRESALERSSSVEQVADAMENAEPWPLDRSDDQWLRIASGILALQKFRRTVTGRAS
jgi:glycosyltransferase involved in cell wall biosynthesis